ncbi:MAG: response regulator [Deltaproteobacteria bacterium]|nr:response regulator [Deltaproteobacteria bacterium]
MTRPPRILVVDDDRANRKLLADLVAREGCEAILASGGAEALAILLREPVDLMLLDIMMPGLDGLGVLTELQRQGALPALPVVVVTALEDRQLRIDALSAGAIDFLSKPIDRLEVALKIRTLMELRRLRDLSVRAVERALHETEHRLQLTFEQSPVARIEWDNEQRVTAWNPAAERLFGFRLTEALGQHASFLAPGVAAATIAARFRDVTGSPSTIATRENTTRDGRVIVCEWHNAPLRLTDGTLVGISSVVLDVTERTRLQEALVQARKMDAIGRLAGGVAHDFNNILAVILSYGTFVRDSLPEGDARRADMVEALSAVSRGIGLTRQLLTFSRQQPTEKRPTDLNDSLDQLHRLLTRTVGEDIELDVLPSPRRAVVSIDPVQFDQVVLNLVVNARDAMPRGGVLRIALAQPPDQARQVELTVRDTGVGMDEATRLRVFEPFFTTKDQGKGTGLGMATCFGIVQDAGGTVRVDSAVGRGTTVIVTLPLCDDLVAAAPLVEPDLRRPGRGETVLVVEDEPGLRRSTARVFESAGYRVVTAVDGKDAQRHIDALGPELTAIFSDVVMPGASGYEVAAHAARVAPRAAIVLTSGYVDAAATRPPRDDLPIVWKPASPRELVRAIADAIAASSATSTAPVPCREVVLVVEDSEPVLKVTTRLLAMAGHETLAATTLAEARAALTREPAVAAVISDLSLPDGSGGELVAWIREHRPALIPRVIVMTGSMPVGDARRELERGGVAVVTKPVPSKELLQLVADGATAARAAQAAPPRPRPVSPAPPLAAGPQVRRERVLVVDDDEALIAAIARILGSAGCEVVAVTTVSAGKVALAEREFDALITDLRLPDGGGLDLVDERRGGNADLPIILLGNAPSGEVVASAMRRGVSDYLPKPFAADDLVRVVRNVVATGRVARLRTKLLTARFGGDEFARDVAGTARHFQHALPRIQVAFQPIVRSGDGSVFGYEALLRSDEPSMATPQRLLAAAEVLGRVGEVGAAVRASVAATMRAHRDRIDAIFVNVHPAELRPELLAVATDPLMPLARRVVLEVTERAGLVVGPRLDEDLASIRAMGYRVAVDDLGEGPTGLMTLVQLRPDFAKIDISLVRGVDAAPLKRDIVAAIVDMTRRAGIVTIAEGIETSAERDTLADLGCELLQGFLFAPPGPAFPAPRDRRP